MYIPTKIKLLSSILILALLSISCSSDSVDDNDVLEDEIKSPEEENSNDPETPCTDFSKFIFNEENSIILVEFENAIFETGWVLVNDDSNSIGLSYMVWEGNNSFSSPGNGLASYTIRIKTPGTYRFIWKSSVKEGTNGTESNDTWLRFSDASNFYGEKSNGNIIYPKGLGKTPNPNGASSNGWFKIYRSGNDLDFKWQASTSDHDAHDIFVNFDTTGNYKMEISGRSKGHAIDKFLLYQPSKYSQKEAVEHNNFSIISCQ